MHDLAMLVANWAPSRAPLKWLAVNLVCWVASLVLLAHLLLSLLLWEVEGDASLKPVAASLYLIWNFSTTVVWCVESGLKFLEQQHVLAPTSRPSSSSQPLGSGWALRLEVAVAIYFLADSIHLLIQWRLRDDDLEANLLEASVSSLAYLWVSVECWQLHYGRLPGFTHVSELLRDDNHDDYVDQATVLPEF
jgi:hypothetical protein